MCEWMDHDHASVVPLLRDTITRTISTLDVTFDCILLLIVVVVVVVAAMLLLLLESFKLPTEVFFRNRDDDMIKITFCRNCNAFE